MVTSPAKCEDGLLATLRGALMLELWIRHRTWWQSDDGASLVEYALLLLLIAVVAVVVITQIGSTTSSAIDKVNTGF